MALTRRTSGTSPRSPPSSRWRTAWRTLLPCARTLNSTPWGGADTDDRNVFRTGRSADDQIGLEFDRALDEFVVRFAALPRSLNTPVPPREGTMGATLTSAANNTSMRRP